MGMNEDQEKDEFTEKTEHNSKLLDTLSIIRFHISKHYSYDGKGRGWSNNQKTMEYEDDIIAILKCIFWCY